MDKHFILGNVLTLVALFTSKKLRNSTNIFLGSLAVADSLVIGLSMPMHVSIKETTIVQILYF